MPSDAMLWQHGIMLWQHARRLEADASHVVGRKLLEIIDAVHSEAMLLPSCFCLRKGISSWCLCCREVPAYAADAGAMTTTNKLLCDEECIAKLDGLQTEETKTGLKYKDIVVGTGPSPPTGYQVQ